MSGRGEGPREGERQGEREAGTQGGRRWGFDAVRELGGRPQISLVAFGMVCLSKMLFRWMHDYLSEMGAKKKRHMGGTSKQINKLEGPSW